MLGVVIVWLVILAWAIYGLSVLPENIELSTILRWVRQGDPVKGIAYIALSISVVVVALYFWNRSPIAEEAIKGVYSNWFTDLIFFIFTVLVIDRLIEWRNRQQEKERTIEQLGSAVNGIALEAVRVARKHGWLSDGSLVGANLQAANLQQANLWIFKEEYQEIATSRREDLREIMLTVDMGNDSISAPYYAADLRNADLSRANFDHALMVGCNFQKTYLVSTQFYYAFLLGADFQGAMVWGTNFEGANLYNANFCDTELFDVNLEDADLSYANFENATLFTVKLKGANLSNTYFQGVQYNKETVWPKGFDPGAAGARLIDKYR